MFTILIVEDNFLFLEVVRDAMRSNFLFSEVAKAKGVEETLAALDTMRPDVIFLHIGPSSSSGFERTCQLCTAGIRTSVTVFTSHDLPDHCAASGA